MNQPVYVRMVGSLGLALMVVLGACVPGQPPSAQPPKDAPATQPAAKQEPAAKSAPAEKAGSEWDAIVAAAKREGTVVRSSFTPSRGGEENLVKRFEEIYGIRVEETTQRAGDFMARFQAELAADKQSFDVRSSSSAECRDLALQGYLQPYGRLPEAEAPGVPWIFDPTMDLKEGKGDTLVRSNGVWFLPVNNRLIPPDQGPRSYKDLADPKYRGMIVLDEPGPVSFGTLWAASTWDIYGEQYVRDVLANVKALSRNAQEAMAQTMQGVYGIYIHANAGALVDLMKLPEPRPVRLVSPEDGYMSSTGAYCILKGAPHPNAAKVFLNFALTQEANQIIVDQPGGGPIRRDVTPALPELTPQIKPDIKFFHENPNSYDFQVVSRKYFVFAEKTANMLPEFGLK